ncbi:hypothetical protein CEXT_96701 [Caerostris extrusa]|uniref:Uncharacterized protein n=1 Tax=Caerostris extrusa TaxID=172846 RepID=A0AAV4RGS8_CAEEX|nr:hypothetical protein CEXT_96701 [Caerostris extrusa]
MNKIEQGRKFAKRAGLKALPPIPEPPSICSDGRAGDVSGCMRGSARRHVAFREGEGEIRRSRLTPTALPLKDRNNPGGIA